jgi:hypothetical protein
MECSLFEPVGKQKKRMVFDLDRKMGFFASESEAVRFLNLWANKKSESSSIWTEKWAFLRPNRRQFAI